MVGEPGRHTNREVTGHVGDRGKLKVAGNHVDGQSGSRFRCFQLFSGGCFVVPCLPIRDAGSWVVAHRSVDVRSLSVRDVLEDIAGSRFQLDLVKEHELRVYVVADVPDAVKQFGVDLAVLVARDVDRIENVNFVLEGDGAIGHIEHGFH